PPRPELRPHARPRAGASRCLRRAIPRRGDRGRHGLRGAAECAPVRGGRAADALDQAPGLPRARDRRAVAGRRRDRPVLRLGQEVPRTRPVRPVAGRGPTRGGRRRPRGRGPAHLARDGGCRMNVLYLFGPNMGALGTREPETYGSQTLAEIMEGVDRRAAELGHAVRWQQSDHEGDLIGWLLSAGDEGVDAVVL